MKLVDKEITKKELAQMAKDGFGNMVKAVIDVNKKIMAVDGSLHADEEALLLSNGSNQSDLWGINIYPELKENDLIEFDSMINIKPGNGNTSRGVDNPIIQEQIRTIVLNLVK